MHFLRSTAPVHVSVFVPQFVQLAERNISSRTWRGPCKHLGSLSISHVSALVDAFLGEFAIELSTCGLIRAE